MGKNKSNSSAAKEVTFTSSDQLSVLHRTDESTPVLGGVTRKTQNTFDLLAQRCHGGTSKTSLTQSSGSPKAIQIKSNYSLDTSTSVAKNLLPKESKLESEKLNRSSSVKSKDARKTHVKSLKDQKIEAGRQYSDADLASAVLASAAAGNMMTLTFIHKFYIQFKIQYK